MGTECFPVEKRNFSLQDGKEVKTANAGLEDRTALAGYLKCD